MQVMLGKQPDALINALLSTKIRKLVDISLKLELKVSDSNCFLLAFIARNVYYRKLFILCKITNCA